MIFYIYDEKTKEYIGTQNAFIDPLETKKQGKKVYLVPANATDKKPLETKENQAVIFNGSEWEIVADKSHADYGIMTVYGLLFPKGNRKIPRHDRYRLLIGKLQIQIAAKIVIFGLIHCTGTHHLLLPKGDHSPASRTRARTMPSTV